MLTFALPISACRLVPTLSGRGAYALLLEHAGPNSPRSSHRKPLAGKRRHRPHRETVASREYALVTALAATGDRGAAPTFFLGPLLTMVELFASPKKLALRNKRESATRWPTVGIQPTMCNTQMAGVLTM